jgi:hypothetical protein
MTRTVAHMQAQASQRPHDAQLWFALGMGQMFRAVETVVQAFYRHGLNPELANLGPLLGEMRDPDMGIAAANPNPQPIDGRCVRQIFVRFVRDMLNLSPSALIWPMPGGCRLRSILSRHRLIFCARTTSRPSSMRLAITCFRRQVFRFKWLSVVTRRTVNSPVLTPGSRMRSL